MLDRKGGYTKVFAAEPDRPEGFVFAWHACDPALYLRLGADKDDTWQLDPWFAFWAGAFMVLISTPLRWPVRWFLFIAGADIWPCSC